MKKTGILTALKQASQGLLFPSETDAPFEAFEWSGEQGKPDKARVLELAGVAPGTPTKVKGLDAFPPDQRPDSVELLYYSYHIMVGLGTFFNAIMGLAFLLWLWQRRLFRWRPMLCSIPRMPAISCRGIFSVSNFAAQLRNQGCAVRPTGSVS